MKYQMGKGDGRRPEDRAAIERNWPFKKSQPVLSDGVIVACSACGQKSYISKERRESANEWRNGQGGIGFLCHSCDTLLAVPGVLD